MTINLSTRTATLYSVPLSGDRVYETFDYDKAQQMSNLHSIGIPAAECMDCKAVIPVALVEVPQMEVGKMVIQNQCPQTTSRYMTGHRVLRSDIPEPPESDLDRARREGRL